MIGRYAFGRARLFACRKSFAACRLVSVIRCAISIMLTVSIFYLTGLAFAGSRIFTLSIYGDAIPGGEVVSASIRHPTSPSTESPRSRSLPPPTPGPGSRAAGISPRRAGRKRCHRKLASSTETAIKRVCRIQITADQKPTDDHAEPPVAEAPFVQL